MPAGGKHADPGPVPAEPRYARTRPILVSVVAAVLTADSVLIAIISDPLLGGIFGAVVATLWLLYLWPRLQRDPNRGDLAAARLAAGLRTVDRPGRRDDLERYRQVVPRSALSRGQRSRAELELHRPRRQVPIDGSTRQPVRYCSAKKRP